MTTIDVKLDEVTSKLIMEQLRSFIFDVTVHAFDTSSVVHLRSSPNFTPDRIIALPFTVTLTTLTFNQRSLRQFGNYFWKPSPEGQTAIFLTVTKKNISLVAHRSLLCAYFIDTPVKPKFYAKLPEVIKSSVLIAISGDKSEHRL